MTLTLELSEELEKALQEQAKQRGMSAEQVALQMLQPLVQAEKPRNVLKAYGRLKGRERTVDDFLRERRKEVELENQQYQDRLELHREYQDAESNVS